jgi:FecR protein
MRIEEELISKFTEGLLDEKEAVDLGVAIRKDPDLAKRTIQELDLANLISMELDPGRSEEAFIKTFASLAKRTDEKTKHPLRHRWERSKVLRLIVQMAASIVIFAGVLWQLFPRQDVVVSGTIAQVNNSEGGFEIQRGSQAIPAQQGIPLCHGDRIVGSMPDQHLTFKFSDGSEVALRGGASIRVEEFHIKGKLLSLESGTAHFQVTPQKKLFQVATQHGAVTVVGTAFSVKTGASTMELAVTQGVVTVENVMKHRITVRAGEQAFASKDKPRIRHTITRLARHDATIKNGGFQHGRYGLKKNLLTTNPLKKMNNADFLLKFDLRSLPKNVIHASLRLYCTEIQAPLDTIVVNATRDNNWEEEKLFWEIAPRRSVTPILATWSPKAEQYNTIPLSDAILPKLINQESLSLRLSSQATVNPNEQGEALFVSRQHPDNNKWPALILEIGE